MVSDIKMVFNAENTSIYFCLASKSDNFNNVKMAAVIKTDDQSVDNRSKLCLVNFNASRTKFLAINYLRDSSLLSISMVDADIRKSELLRFLGLMFSPYRKLK